MSGWTIQAWRGVAWRGVDMSNLRYLSLRSDFLIIMNLLICRPTLAAILGSVLIAFTGDTFAQRWTITDLGVVPGDIDSQASGINNNGVIVGVSTSPSSSNARSRPVIWRAGVPTPLTLPVGASASNIGNYLGKYNINDAGQISGSLQFSDGTIKAMRWDGNGTLPIVLTPLGGGYALSINNGGVVVGSSGLAAAWTGSVLSYLDRFPANSAGDISTGYALGINDNGAIVGTMTNSPVIINGTNNQNAVIWDTLNSAVSPLPGIDAGTQIASQAIAINNNGMVIGEISNSGDPNPFAYWIDRAPFRLNWPPGGCNLGLTALNNKGDIVGCGGVSPLLWRGGIYYNLIANSDAAQNGWTYLFPQAINDAGKIVGFGIRNGKGRAFLLTSTFTAALVDPVPSGTNDQSLVEGNKITTSVSALATGGRPVGGVSADGVAQILIRISATSVGDVFTLNFAPSVCSTVGTKCVQSYGRIYPVDSQATANYDDTAAQIDITVTAKPTPAGPMAFAIYRAPTDFIRSDSLTNATSDAVTTQRQVDIAVTSPTLPPATMLSIVVVRPPVVLVHGLWADQYDLGGLVALADYPSQPTPLFNVYRANYGQPITVLDGTPPKPSLGQLTDSLLPPGGSSLGIAYGATLTLSQVNNSIIPGYRRGENAAKIPVAAIRADFVSHSMGALVTRMLERLPAFYQQLNYGRGLIHKVVSIGGPHLGSPLARDLLKPENECVRSVVASQGMYAFTNVVANTGAPVGRYVGYGAVGDLSGDGAGNGISPAIQKIRERPIVPVPIAFISGIMTSTQIENLIVEPLTFGPVPGSPFPLPKPINHIQSIRFACEYLRGHPNPLAISLSSPSKFIAFMNRYSDGIVPQPSQTNGNILTAAYPVAPISAALHSPGAAKLYNRFRMDVPKEATLLDRATIPLVVKLLNTPVVDTETYIR